VKFFGDCRILRLSVIQPELYHALIRIFDLVVESRTHGRHFLEDFSFSFLRTAKNMLLESTMFVDFVFLDADLPVTLVIFMSLHMFLPAAPLSHCATFLIHI